MSSAAKPPVELVLDLRLYSGRPSGLDDYLALWDELEPALTGHALKVGHTHQLEVDGRGRIGLTVLAVPPGEPVVSGATPFAIHSVLEPPERRDACSVCAAGGVDSYGPLFCPQCAHQGKRTHLCDDHAVILDGSLRSFCPDHHPRAPSGAPATFWCLGPGCRGRKAWADDQRVAHPNNPDVWFCRACYAELFPPCTVAGCARFGTLSCERVEPGGGAVCGRRVCAHHVRQWRVYASQDEGLSLCPAHSDIQSLPDREIVERIVAGTALRRLRVKERLRRRVDPRDLPELPSLQTFGFVFRHDRGRHYQPQAVEPILEELTGRLDAGSPMRAEMADVLARSLPRRQANLRRDAAEKQAGREWFARIQDDFRTRLSLPDVADALAFSDFRPNVGPAGTVFVKLDSKLKWKFNGPDERRKRDVEHHVGVWVRLES